MSHRPAKLHLPRHPDSLDDATGYSASVLLALALACLLVPPAATALDGDHAGFTPLARLFAGNPNRVLLRGSTAYAALDSGLGTFEVRVADQPVPLDHVYLPGRALDLDLQGTLAYVADEEGGLQIVDVGDPSALAPVGSLSAPGARAVAVAGSVAYLAMAAPGPTALRGLLTVDVSDPSAPAELGFVPLPNGALDVLVSGTTAFVAAGSLLAAPGHGLFAVDVSDPANPWLVPGGFLDTSEPVNQVAALGNVGFLAAGAGSAGAFLVVDLSVPAQPRLLARMPLRDAARGLSVLPGRASVAAGSLGLLAFDVSDPSRPWLADALATGRETVAVAARGDLTVLAERSSNGHAGLTAVDTLDATAARAGGSVASAEATGVVAAPGSVYLLQRDALHLFAESSSGVLEPLSSWTADPADFTALAAEGPLAAVAAGAQVFLVDVSDPYNPRSLGAVAVCDGIAVRPVLDGALLYVVTGRGLEVTDLTSPTAPNLLASFPTAGWSSALALDGRRGYLVAGNTLHVLDLGTPAAPSEIGSLAIAGEELFGVAASGALVVLTGLANLLYVVDLANPGAPVLEGLLVGGTGFDVKLLGDKALIAAGQAGVVVADLTSPAAPRVIGYDDTAGTAIALANDGPLVFVATLEAQDWVTRCEVCACASTGPTPTPNSLAAVKGGSDVVLSWTSSPGGGATNLHRTLDKVSLPGLFADPGSIVGATAGQSLTDAFAPLPGTVGFYRVFGVDSCTGASHGP